jgi:peptide/nickel transport system ATP-binding protein
MTSCEDAVLEIDGLSIRLPKSADRELAVRDATLKLRRGRTLCLVGESGSGKSLIASTIMGLLPAGVEAAGGSIRFGAENLLDKNDAAMRPLRGSRIAMVFQEPMTALNPLMRIGEQLGELLDAHESLPAIERQQRIVEALRKVELPQPEQLARSYPFALSGGQRQRVMIAAAMLLRPDVLIADEPTTALDVTTQAQILRLMLRLQEEVGTAVLFITHDLGVVAQIADDVAVICRGEIVEQGPAHEVLARPSHAYTRQLIAAMPDLQANAKSGAPEAPILSVRNLCKTYAAQGGFGRKRREAVRALDDVCLQLGRGRTLGIVGESGSGKSSLGRCIAGLMPYDSGEVHFEGKPCGRAERRPREERGRIQMVFQDPYSSLNPKQRIGDAIAAGMIVKGRSRQAAWMEGLRLLKLVGLGSDAADRYPHEFSGGQRQRIAIARALATEPKLLIADEPVSALDLSIQAQVLELFADIRRRLGIAMVFITHDLRIAAHLCDEIAVMRHGSVVEYGPAADVLGAPSHPYTRRLVDAIPKMPGFASTEDPSAPAKRLQHSRAE